MRWLVVTILALGLVATGCGAAGTTTTTAAQTTSTTAASTTTSAASTTTTAAPTTTTAAPTTTTELTTTSTAPSEADLLAGAAKAADSAVVVNIPYEGQSHMVVSGLVYSADGVVVTCDGSWSEDGSGGSITVTLTSGTTLPATIVGRDTANHIAVLKVHAADLTPVKFSTAPVKQGDEVALLTFRSSPSVVGVSGINASLAGTGHTGLIRVGVPPATLTMGAMLLGADGGLVGMLITGLLLHEQNNGYAVPAATLLGSVKKILGQ
jgi:S1-C subfamily serine protease